MLAALLGVLGVAGVVLVVVLLRQRGRAGDGSERASSEAEALDRSGLSAALTGAGFAVARPGLFVRGRVEVHALVARDAPVVESVDVRVLGVSGRPIASTPDFLAHAKRSPDGAVRVQAHLEVREGKGTVRRDAPAAETERFSAIVNAHLATLDAVSWTAVDLFNHRVPRLHVYLRPASGPAGGEQVEQAARLIEQIFDELAERAGAVQDGIDASA